MNFTEEEQQSLELAITRFGEKVRRIYFAMKRCEDCKPQGNKLFRSCDYHANLMIKADELR